MPLHDRTAASPAFTAASNSPGEAPARRGSGMVERDRPQAVPRPSPDWTEETDRAAFEAAWMRERRDAEEPGRAVRRAAFKASRMQEYSPERRKTFNRRAARQPS